MAFFVIGTIVAVGKLKAKGIHMDTAQDASLQQMTDAIYARLTAQWEGWKNKDPKPNDAIIADDFHSFQPDGTRHVGRPTVQQMIEQPIAAYKLSQFRAIPVGADTALVTYFADITTPDTLLHHMAVGEVWVHRNHHWFIRAFSGTLMQ